MNSIAANNKCYHCGDACENHIINFDEKNFCCNGCVSVYKILHQHQLLDYYCLNENPGIKQEFKENIERFNFLDLESISSQLIEFKNAQQTRIELYLPQIHCSSCLWLLEHLNEFDEGIIYSKVNFTTKRITIHYLHDSISLKEVVCLLSSLGYEPLIDLYQPEQKRLSTKYNSKTSYLKIGIAGFCFANIMLISFPEYLGLNPELHPSLNVVFKWLNLILSLPVILYSASEFFENSYYSFKQKYLNIDVPIALAITVTFIRSVYEVISGTGAGFFDSMTGIVFFMLLGRTLQNRTYTTLQFDKNIRSYFPLAVSRILKDKTETVQIQDIQENDELFIHTQEVIPTDCLLSKGEALIDYSFITGESMPEIVEKGSIIYAGGKNVGSSIEVVVLKPFSDNSFTKLWNNNTFNKDAFEKEAMTTVISKYFSFVVILISLSTFTYWSFVDSSIAWKAATAVLIIACPCALLLTASFTNGYLLEILSKHGIFYKNSDVIEKMAISNHIAFDKTGTLTNVQSSQIQIAYNTLNEAELELVLQAMSQSSHPLSKSLVKYYNIQPRYHSEKIQIEELPNKGIRFYHNSEEWRIGSKEFTLGEKIDTEHTEVFISVNKNLKAHFIFHIALIPGIENMLDEIAHTHSISLISGDNAASKRYLEKIFPKNSVLQFDCSPTDKLQHIADYQKQNKTVIMVGDGINDAGALRQSDVGISLVKETFAFSPSSDIIMEDKNIVHLNDLIKLNKATMRLIWFGFFYSLIFNFIGIYFSVTGQLSPLIAAILMPSSSLGIIFIAFLGMNFLSKKYLAKEKQEQVIIKADKNHIYT